MIKPDLFVDSHEALSRLLAAIAPSAVLALDTEFVREKTYYPRLCLIQIASGDLTACVDCLAGLDLEPFFDFLLDQDRLWVLHSARQDLEIIFQHTSRLPSALIDTQIAAGLLGYPQQIGLADILAEKLRVELGKSYARTDWSRRPLPQPALRYALDDVRHLLPLWDNLQRSLRERGRGGWVEQDCRTMLNTPPITPPVTIWTRLRGLGALDAEGQGAALALVRWRETRAQTLDRPRRWLMSDELLLRVARARPRDPSELTEIPEMPARLAQRWGTEMLAGIRRCDQAEVQALIATHLNGARPDKATLRQLHERVRKRSKDLGIATEILATRKELSELATGTKSARIGEGWRWSEIEPLLSDD